MVYVFLVDNVAFEIIPAVVNVEGRDVPIEERYHPDFVAALIQVVTAPDLGDIFDGVKFNKPVAPEIPESELRARKLALLQRHMDGVAQDFGFLDISDAVSYADEDADPQSQALGLALRSWRSLCRASGNAILNSVRDGGRTMPTDEGFISELPVFHAPANP